MRISTQSFYEQSKSAISTLQSSTLRTQQQMAAGTKILAPSDDPLGATRALGMSQSLALNAQYADNRRYASQSLMQEESVLNSVTDVLQDVKTLVIQAGGVLSDSDRTTIATTLQSKLDQLQALANSDDGNGQFLFGGFKSGTPPFVRSASGTVSYVGDRGQRMVQVDVSRQMAATNDGLAIFQTVPASAGYVTSAPTTNTGSGVFGAVSVQDRSNASYGQDFVISFSGTQPLKYQVNTTATPPVSLVAPTNYTSGGVIKFGGLQINITGTPNAADTFKVTTAAKAGTSMFSAISDAINVLKTPIDNQGQPSQAKLANALSTANRKITNAHDNVSVVRASVGSRLQELDALDANGESRALFEKSYLSNLQDLDYASAISDFQLRQVALQASQQTFVKAQQIALFNYL